MGCFVPQPATSLAQDYSVEGMSDSLLNFLQHLREFGLVFQRKVRAPGYMVLGKRQGGMVPGPLKSSGVLGGRSGKQCWDWILGSLVGEKL